MPTQQGATVTLPFQLWAWRASLTKPLSKLTAVRLNFLSSAIAGPRARKLALYSLLHIHKQQNLEVLKIR
jgi:hypothetical protein